MAYQISLFCLVTSQIIPFSATVFKVLYHGVTGSVLCSFKDIERNIRTLT